jgi:uncharacterized membrane protein YccC
MLEDVFDIVCLIAMLIAIWIEIDLFTKITATVAIVCYIINKRERSTQNPNKKRGT